jgi:hypothetical protein
VIVTETEAATKWCSFVRDGDSNQAAVNQVDGYEKMPWNSCKGSACMSWRWVHKPGEVYQGVNGLQSDEPATARGYCGIAYGARLP